MPAIILPGDGFVGIADERRRAIYEAEKAAGAMGVLPDDKEKRAAIIDRLGRRLSAANKGWGMNQEETVVRVDDYGVARVIPKSQAVGWISGLPAAPDATDSTSGSAQVGRTRPFTQQVSFPDPGALQPVSARVAAQNFYARIRNEMERSGYIPAPLRQELLAQGWRMGQPVPLVELEAWCSRFQEQWNAKRRLS